jgi:hypothetical protein
MAKKGHRVKHHHHKMTVLIQRYQHLSEEQRMTAFEADILTLMSALDARQAAKVLAKIISKQPPDRPASH